jgi:hypothetical protein
MWSEPEMLGEMDFLAAEVGHGKVSDAEIFARGKGGRHE